MQTNALTIAAAILLLAGCSSTIDERLVGSWQIAQPESLTKKVAGEDQSPSEPTVNANMTVQFHRSGTLTTTTRMGKIDSVKTGTWTAISENRNSDIIQIQCQLGMQATEHEIELIDSDSIRWIPPNMAGTKQKLRFVRVGT